MEFTTATEFIKNHPNIDYEEIKNIEARAFDFYESQHNKYKNGYHFYTLQYITTFFLEWEYIRREIIKHG